MNYNSEELATKKEKRFELVEKNRGVGYGASVVIIHDKETGGQYLIASTGFGGGIIVLVDKDGKPLLK